MRFLIVAALLAAALYSYSALAAVPTATHAIITNTVPPLVERAIGLCPICNGTTINSVQMPNASIARAADQLFLHSNFSSENATQEVNSTYGNADDVVEL